MERRRSYDRGYRPCGGAARPLQPQLRRCRLRAGQEVDGRRGGHGEGHPPRAASLDEREGRYLQPRVLRPVCTADEDYPAWHPDIDRIDLDPREGEADRVRYTEGGQMQAEGD